MGNEGRRQADLSPAANVLVLSHPAKIIGLLIYINTMKSFSLINYPEQAKQPHQDGNKYNII
jgi:hypothetical protein